MPGGLRVGAWLLLLFQAAGLVAGEAEEITVEIASGNVVLTCPGVKSRWTKSGSGTGEESNVLEISDAKELLQIERGKQYSCNHNATQSLDIYLKIRGCEDCVELSLGLGAGILVADLLLTLAVLLLAYLCSQKQRQALFRPGAPRKPQGQQADRAPPVPNPDYEPIRKAQREVYAGLGHQPS
ncbi:T-cell surface glycoprotein CD3 epsilon chain isoform X2 [Erythrolamprus reginae]|uniref:T-cell surface glycoprotein CD3 epsilon chain isoform X2 n=1 Tax=Erythrolamprus reginae TaxID=121349 RepID=UPI00396CD447